MTAFRINYTKVISQANAISKLADDLNSQIRQFEELEKDVKINWQGEAASTFLKQTAILQSNMNNTYCKINNLSNTIKNIANKIKREDEVAAERARKLSQN